MSDEPEGSGGSADGALQMIPPGALRPVSIGEGDFAQALANAHRRHVCQIHAPVGALVSPIGTGFLVGPDLVLTAYHVLEHKLETRDDRTRISLRFDRIARVDGGVAEGTTCLLADSDDCVVDWSPYDPREVKGDTLPDLPDAEKLDFVLLRTGQCIGEDRGWIHLSPGPPPKAGAVMAAVLHYPRGEPMAWSIGKVNVDPEGTRVSYPIATDQGSSGSPVLAEGGNLLAVHHRGDKVQNWGIPAWLIARRQRVAAALPAGRGASDSGGRKRDTTSDWRLEKISDVALGLATAVQGFLAALVAVAADPVLQPSKGGLKVRLPGGLEIDMADNQHVLQHVLKERWDAARPAFAALRHAEQAAAILLPPEITSLCKELWKLHDSVFANQQSWVSMYGQPGTEVVRFREKGVGDGVIAQAEVLRVRVLAALRPLAHGMEADQEPPLDSEGAALHQYSQAMGAVHPLIVPVLTRLASSYADRPHDRFFRAAGRLLQDIVPEELDYLRDHVRNMCDFFARSKGPDPVSWTFRGPHAELLVRRLEAQGLVRHAQPVADTHGQTDRMVASITSEDAKRLLTVLGD